MTIKIDDMTIKIDGITVKIDEKTISIDEITINIDEMTIKINQNGQTSKAKNELSEPDRPKIEKVKRQFKKKMIGFGRPDEIEKKCPWQAIPSGCIQKLSKSQKYQWKSMK